MNTELFLTFAQAMALDPSEVEFFCCLNAKWIMGDQADGYALSLLRAWTWRRARPKRSRVQEMVATRFPGNDPASETEREIVAGRYTEAILAVCEWLRPMPLSQQRTGQDWAGKIEREFLEPR